MKNLFLIFNCLWCCSFSYSQDNQRIIDDLYNPEIYISSSAIFEIRMNNLEDAYPHLLELYDSKPLVIKADILQALYQFGDPDIKTKATMFIESIDKASKNELEYISDPLLEKVEAASILIKLNDFTFVDLVFELINRDGVDHINSTAFQLLDYIINVPIYESNAKNILMAQYNSKSEYHRYFAMYFLTEKYGSEMIEKLKSSFVSDLDIPIRSQALEYLLELDKNNLRPLLRTSFRNDSAWSFRTSLVDTLLAYYGQPSDLKSVIEYQPTEPNETARSLMGFSIKFFIPPKPKMATPDMIDTLISFTTQLFQYNWIKDSTNYKSYLSELEKQKKVYFEKDEDKLIDSIDNFIEIVEEHRKAELLTEEGYKFMHYYETYIKENVEKDF